ncbi:MAG: glycerol-3-phosphate 1-O-acyltransferase PlsY [Clostridia bacterium]|jgi:glycerol-3-phosphate acyltransferase PlsY
MIGRYILLAVMGYFIGSFPTAYIVGKVMGNIDIRKYGSKNPGATNMFRVLGAKAGVITFLGDGLKGVLASLIGGWIGLEIGAYICGSAAVIGHNWPAFSRFKGGKGIATSLGAIMVLQPLIGLGMLAVGIASIILTRYVSLASIGGAVAFPVIVLLTKSDNRPLVVFSLLLGVIALIRHYENIRRLLSGTENRLKFRKTSE